MKTVRELKRGEYFTKREIEYARDSQVWIRGEYDRELKKYMCVRFDDACTTCYMAGNKPAYTDFIF